MAVRNPGAAKNCHQPPDFASKMHGQRWRMQSISFLSSTALVKVSASVWNLTVTGFDLSPKHEYLLSSALMLGFFAGAQGIALLPFWLGASIDSFDLSDSAGGWLGSVQLGTGALVSFAVALIIHRMDRRRLLRTGAAVSILGNACAIASLNADLLEFFYVGRAVAGLGDGVILATVCAAAAGTHNPIRMFALMNGAFAVIAGVFYLSSPPFIVSHGATAIFAFMMLMTLAAAAFSSCVPKHPTDSPGSAPAALAAPAGFAGISWLGLTMFGLFAVVTGGVWAYVERIGLHRIGLALDRIGVIIAIAAMLFVVGPYLADRIGMRFGHVVPLGAIFVAYGIVALAFTIAATPLLYVLAVIGHAVTCGYSTTFISALFAEMDASGRVAGASPAFNSIGNAMGPSTMGATAGLLPDYQNIGITALVLLSIVTPCFLMIGNHLDQRAIETSPAG